MAVIPGLCSCCGHVACQCNSSSAPAQMAIDNNAHGIPFSHPGMSAGIEMGVKHERAAIVAWLRAQGEGGGRIYDCETLADAIERGEHLNQPKGE